MKKILLITAAIGAISAVPAAAVQECIQRPSQCWNSQTGRGNAEARFASCDDENGNEIYTVYGVSKCSNQSGSLYQLSENLTVSDTPSENYHCWCKITSPAVSKWFFVVSYRADYADCEYECMGFCDTIDEDKLADVVISAMGI